MPSAYPTSLREEELKNKVAADWFGAFDCTRIIGNIDFCVDIPATELALGFEAEPVLWAEAKAGNKKDIVASFVQLILTIGGQRTADKNLPPHFLGAFDAEKIAFLPYNAVLDVLGKNDFDWTVAPSDHESKEFKELYDLAKGVVEREKLMFRYADDETALRRFIKSNFKSGRRDITKILINKNNFTHIYRQWREAVMPFINAPWDVLKKKYAIYDRDFYLAEMNIDDNGTADITDDRVANDFYITFDAKSSTPYTVKRKNEDDLFATIAFGFKPGGLDAYAAFWRRYKRPPRKDYWNFIVNRLDLLVPQDVRERKGSFFTPKKWVELSQHYLELALGADWQDDHYIWDCCAGTGNLLVGLTNKYNIWASTLDQPDVDVMRERIKGGAALLDSHVFQFDFLNDSFDKLPQGLRDIINDPDKRRKLVIYINPPYAEAASTRTKTGSSENKPGVAAHSLNEKYKPIIGAAVNELFALFLMRIVDSMPGCVVGQFSKLKHLQSPNFAAFRKAFKGRIEKSFLVPADTFDNVKGKFPIGFFVWRLGENVSRGGAETRSCPLCNSASLREEKSAAFTSAVADVYDRNGEFAGNRKIFSNDGTELLMDWIRQFYDKAGERFAYCRYLGSDFQNNGGVFITLKPSENDLKQVKGNWITPNNHVEFAVYFAVRLCIEADWLNDRDQFLFPNDGWKTDSEFQNDCLVFALFHGQNRISSRDGVNHWIPFTEEEVGAKDCFKSHFMSDLINGRGLSNLNPENPVNPVENLSAHSAPLGTRFARRVRFPMGREPPQGAVTRLCVKENMSPAATSVLDAGRELWRYYHSQPDANPDASYYDIRMHFQGATVDAKGKSKMNSDSKDAKYTELIGNLRAAMKRLAKEIEPKVYEYGFLRR